jgi:L-2-hydroxyglutarate oxidase LhgO
MLREADVLVIGAGVVGLACAVELAKRGHFVTVLERHDRVATENSSRNSGVVHSGLYYPAGSTKARLCVRGRELLYARCKKFGIAHRKLGKLIVARDDAEAGVLERLARRADDNGAGPVRLVDGIELAMLEEQIAGHAALLVEETGVLRTQELVRSLVREAEALRVELVVGMEVTALERDARAETRECWEVRVHDTGREAGGYVAPWVVDAAGLAADRIARLAGIDTERAGLTQRYCKGSWVALDERYRKFIGRLVYPVPHVEGDGSAAPTALGVHLTRDLEGFLFAGPDAEWVDAPDFALDPSKPEAMRDAVARWIPTIAAHELVPLAAGVRPKLHGPGEPAADFAIRDGASLGAPGLVVLAGIESPGLTACLAIAEEVVAIVEAQR